MSAERELAAVRAFNILKDNKTVIFVTLQSRVSINLRVAQLSHSSQGRISLYLPRIAHSQEKSYSARCVHYEISL